MADLVTASALAFTAAYLILRNRPVSETKVVAASALKSTEQVMTTNIRTRMGDAIGTGSEIGVTRAQMNATQKMTEADVHLGGPPLRPTLPPSMLSIQPVALNTRPPGAPGAPMHALPLGDAHARNERTADAVARAERARKLRDNASKSVSMRSAKNKDLDQMKVMIEPWLMGGARPMRSVGEAERIVDTLPAYALVHDANARRQQIQSVSAEPGDMVKMAALA